ncbi:MAG: HYR domain-containing protein [Bacteroidia bacterium]|nr:HYR domain-containing protein [Bacteroidia bacterium]
MMSAVTTFFKRLPILGLLLAGMATLPQGRMIAQPVFSNVSHVVTTLVDELDASADSTVGAGTSLREAITYAGSGDMILFGPVVRGSIYLTLGTINVPEDLIITGPGAAALEINGNDLSSLFNLDSAALLITDLSFSSGRALNGAVFMSRNWLSVKSCDFRWSTAISNGGAIWHDGSTLLLSKCRFLNNDAFFNGGAVYAEAGTIGIDSCVFRDNGAGSSGGALNLGAVTATITNTSFEDNSAGANGGAISLAFGGTLSSLQSTASGNNAGNGGGVFNAGTLTVHSSTLSGNTADNNGGGLANAVGGSATVDFSTVAFNGADNGGGVWNAGTFSTKRSIFAENSAPVGPNVSGAASSTGTNLVQDDAGSSGWLGSDLTGTLSKPVNAGLDDLRLNAGVTKTHGLLACSRAVDAADSTGTFNMKDQRGSNRKVNGDNDGIAKPDIGAYEAQGILDTEAPTFTPFPGFTVYLDSATGTANISADTLILSAFDNCEVVSKSISKTSYSCSDIGTVSVTLTVRDRAHNVTTQNIDVFVVDRTPPAVTPPANISVNAAGNACNAAVNLGTPTTTDACGISSVSSSPAGPFPVGVTTVIWTVEDNNGNITLAKQTVTVIDNSAPVLTVPANVTVTAPGNACSISRGLVPLGTASATDNCSATISNNAPAFFQLGATTVTWSAVDPSGNLATGNQTVTVVDQTPPAISAPGDLNLIADPGVCYRDGANVNLGLPSAVDNCTGVTLSNNKPATFPIGVTLVTWIATDGNGNSASAIQKVTIFDGNIPTVVAPPDIVVDADPGLCYWTVDNNVLGTATGTDNCGVPNLVNNAGSTLSVGVHRIIWTATDAYGNRSTDVQLVTVVGDPPTIACPANIVVSTDPGMAGAVVNFTPPVANSTCADVEVIRTEGLGSGSFFPLGTTTVSYLAIDGSNQTATCSFTVTVEDNEAPQIWVKVAPRYLWPADNKLYDIKATVEVWDNVPGTTARLTSITCNQNANGDIVGETIGVFDDMFQLRAKRDNGPRTYTITYEAIDAANNTTFASATVTVPTQKPKDADIEEGELPIPTGVTLAQNYPNPFNPTTTISFGTPDTRHMELVIFDVMGRPIRTLFDVVLDAGSYSVTWDGRSDAGETVPSGMYIYQLRAGDVRLEQKMLLAR